MKSDNADSAVRAVVGKVAREQGGTEPASGNLAAPKSTPGWPTEPARGNDPNDYSWAPRRDFGPEDNVSWHDDDHLF